MSSPQSPEEIKAKLSKKEQKKIVFLYISIDQSEEKWKKAIELLHIEGEHAFSNARWSDGAGRVFNVSGIPRYMIMDKSGKIINNNAKRPSMQGIMDELLKLI